MFWQTETLSSLTRHPVEHVSAIFRAATSRLGSTDVCYGLFKWEWERPKAILFSIRAESRIHEIQLNMFIVYFTIIGLRK